VRIVMRCSLPLPLAPPPPSSTSSFCGLHLLGPYPWLLTN
jgi:hypothetical protein